jgi:hypothetical protein
MNYLCTVTVLFLLIAIFSRFETPFQKLTKFFALGMSAWGGFELFNSLGFFAKLGIKLFL